ncbi:sulfurtransferase TusA family protein [Sulfobacillus thermosulfidooxidans]|uniref:TusA-related sulfurtransferase n=2 Tax=Sulfobacillus thermosulfidooxidans TaxID=28034 RepID=A0A1W1WJC1_SULTA|nr:sulfurtransferase TusA family protein [Sulfobacillus thermosulfidooxidans]OLZ12171.1 preprotein translocase subunit TatB [Sulfobacillus thermosulfidooxidans]OLZ13049.1 preprotein translocase subunit TatB [Sulfobacillus thermosulfidooxidans]OLZ21429.1 preprotein translocase subunit TatB [Sulfobacillus thermosulfidooxidans]PSR27501.1 MAG: sulfurtransferase TusA family protein [Sulfobacillus thermosulfidooxidans]SMC06367.1 TusA-related sulfurtransferase [Sulfobacillus thermosulfidooxidans DSM 
MSTPVEADLKVDASGLKCPMPVIRAKKGITSVEVGQVVEILSTDPGSMADFKAWARSTGHELLLAEQQGEVFRFLIRRTK